MIFRETLLKKTGAKLFEYISDSKEIKPAMLVIPGGGYSVVCTERKNNTYPESGKSSWYTL